MNAYKRPEDPEFGIGTLISYTLPYSIGYCIVLIHAGRLDDDWRSDRTGRRPLHLIEHKKIPGFGRGFFCAQLLTFLARRPGAMLM